MQTMRRRGLAPAARARAGENASRQGKASDTPAARRNVRRGRAIGRSSVIGRRASGPHSLGLECLALDDLVNESSEAVILLAEPGDDGVDLRPVGLRGWTARGVGQQFFGQGAGQLILVLQEQLL